MTVLAQHSADRPRRPLLVVVLPLTLRSLSWPSSRPVILPMIILANLMVMAVAARAVFPLSVMYTVSLPVLGWLAWSWESTSTRTLAFLKTLPLKVPPRSFIFAPLCVTAVLVVAAARLAFPFGVANGASVLAMSWWAFVAGRWLAPRRSWLAALALPLVCWLPMLPADFAARRAGDWAAAAVCAIFAAGGLLLSPRDQTEKMLTGWSRRRRVPSLPRGPYPDVSRSTAHVRRENFFVTVWRVWMLSMPRRSRYGLPVMVVVALVVEILNFPLVSPVWLQLPWVLGFVTTQSSSKEALGFLTTKPLSRLHLLTATLLPAGLVVIALNLSLLAEMRPRFFIGPEATLIVSGWVKPAAVLRFLHQVVGATFLPARLPAAGLPAEVWPALRVLLQWHVFRVALLCMALTYSLAGASLAWLHKAEWGWRPWWWRVLLIPCTLVALVPCMPRMVPWRFQWPPAPLWLAACLAAASVISASAHRFVPPRRQGR